MKFSGSWVGFVLEQGREGVTLFLIAGGRSSCRTWTPPAAGPCTNEEGCGDIGPSTAMHKNSRCRWVGDASRWNEKKKKVMKMMMKMMKKTWG